MIEVKPSTCRVCSAYCPVKVTLDEESIGRSSREIEHERAVAIYDLLEENSFYPVGHRAKSAPYWVDLSLDRWTAAH